jgi:hypothetical protein
MLGPGTSEQIGTEPKEKLLYDGPTSKGVTTVKWKVLLLILGSACTVPALAQSAATPLASPAQSVPVVTPVDNSVRVRIPHSTHPKARAEYDAGPVDGAVAMDQMILVLGASAEQEHEARTLVDSQQTKGSPDFHRWLTPEEFGRRFGPSVQEIQEAAGWLRQQGFTVTSVAKSGRWIEFSGTSAQVESAFQTQMRRYQVDGEVHTANATDISIPAALAPVVQGVVSLHDFYSRPAMIPSNRKGTAKLVGGKPLIALGGGGYAIGPQDFATIYDLNPLYNGVAPSPKTTPIDGTGQTIAIIAEGMINTIATTGVDDVASFRQIFSLPSNPANIILTGPGVTLDKVDGEATLDVEWAGAVAPKATIDLVVSAGTLATDPVDLSSIYVVDNNLAPIMNLSFSECEQDFGTAGNAFWNVLFEQAAAQGISVFVASGDWGAADCEPDSLYTAGTALAVNGLSSTPYNTSVGGTEFDETVNGGTNATFWNGGTDLATGYIPEMVWNDCVTQCNYAAGGGISTVYPVPSWQTLPILGLTGAKFPNRALPDVSLAAAEGHDPYVYCFSSHAFDPDCQVRQGVVTFDNFAGGTSFASPEMAGVMALVGQATNSRQGLANYEFYALGAQESANFAACNSSNQTNPATRPGAQCIFNDVTAGNNGVPGNDTLSFVPPGDKTGQLGYNAVAGYDPASGLGSIDAAKLVNAWASAEAGFNGSSTALTASFNGTALPSNAVSIVHGQPVTVTASVSALSGEKTQTPGAEIALLGEDGNLAANTGIASLPISGSGGTATTGAVSVKDLPAGTNYNLYAYFPGDGVFAGSTSNSIALSIAAENTTTALQSGISNGTTVTAGNTLDYGDPANTLIFTVNVAGVSQLLPTTGTVTFTDNGNALATVPLGPDPGGIAEYLDGSASQGTLPLGTHVIGASYGGDGATPPSYNPSASGSVTVTVTKGYPQVVQVRAPSTAVAGQQVNLSTFLDYNYEAAAPTGTIQFMDGTTALGSPVTLTAANGTNAAIVATFTTDGTHALTAQYSGDGNYNSATSPALNLAITAPFALTATSTSQTIQQGQTATYNLTLAGTSFSGTVNLTCTSTNAPAGAQCSVPASETLSSSTTSVPFTVTVATTAAAQTHAPSFSGGTLPLRLAAFLIVVFWGRKRIPGGLLLAALAVFGISACGGGSSQSSPPPPTYAAYTITATSGSQTTSISLNLTINN